MSAALLDPPTVPPRSGSAAAPECPASTAWASTDHLYPLSVAQYHAMGAAGILTTEDRCELLDGLLVKTMTKHPPHNNAVRELLHWFAARVPPDEWTLDVQGPVTLADSEPEPDLWIARGHRSLFRRRNPAPAELALVVEVADSTLPRDRGLKLRLYAAAGIPEYWIVNLTDRQVEVHRQPVAAEGRYAEIEIVPADGLLPVRLDGVELGTLPVAELLP